MAAQQIRQNISQMGHMELKDKNETSIPQPPRFGQQDILFDGGSAQFVVQEIPTMKIIDNFAEKIQKKPIEATAITNELENYTTNNKIPHA